jgi:1,4-dihydroxy-2-naphthoate octaprenyltransferase
MSGSLKRPKGWNIAALIFFGLGAATVVLALASGHRQGPASLPFGAVFLFLGALAVAFGTTAATLGNNFRRIDRWRDPVSFWLSVVLGYVFAVGLLALSVWTVGRILLR